MRERLFRGIRVDNGEWVEGGIYHQKADDVKEEAVYIIGGSLNDVGCAYQVVPESVGEYTEIKDKNNRKIFEGDIIDCWSEGVNAQGAVQQRRDGLWIIYPAWQKHIMWGLCPDEYSNTTVEIIGNVFENNELLEG